MGLNFTTATESHSAHIFYVLQNCKKGQIPEKGFALFKNDITSSEPTSKLWIKQVSVIEAHLR